MSHWVISKHLQSTLPRLWYTSTWCLLLTPSKKHPNKVLCRVFFLGQVLKQIWHFWTNHEGYLWAPVSHLHLSIPRNTPWVLRSFRLPCCPWNGELEKIWPWINPSYTLPHKLTVRQLTKRTLETLITILNDIFSNVGGWIRFTRVIDILVRHLSDKQASNKATLFCLALTRNARPPQSIRWSFFQFSNSSLGPFFGTNNMNTYYIYES